MKIILTAYKRNKARKDFTIIQPVTIIGRSSDCDIHVNDSRVSRKHCKLVLSNGTLKVVDLSSTHGTYINGRRIQEAELTNGDRLSIGRIYFKVKFAHVSNTNEEEPTIVSNSGDILTTSVESDSREAILQSVRNSESEHLKDTSRKSDLRLDAPQKDDQPFSGEFAGMIPSNQEEGRFAQPNAEQDPAVSFRKAHFNHKSAQRRSSKPRKNGRSKSSSKSQKSEGNIIYKETSLAPSSAVTPPSDIFTPLAAPASPPPPRHLLREILRFKWTLIATFLFVSVPAIAAIWMLIKPVYQAKAEVRVRPVIPHLVFKTEDSGMIPFYQSFLNTQVAIIRSPTVLQHVLDQKDVQQTKWYKQPRRSPFRQPDTPLERIRKDLSVRPRPRTEIIDVAFTALNPKDAEIILNATLDNYIKYVSEASDKTKDELYRQLVEKYTSLEQEITGREVVLAKLRKELGTNDPDELVSKQRVRLDETKAELDKIKREISLLEWQRNELEKLLKESTHATNKYYGDPEWRRLNIAVKTAKHKLEVARKEFKDSHPRVIELKSEYEFAQKLLKSREKQLAEQQRLHLYSPSDNAGNKPNYWSELSDIRLRLKVLARQEKLLFDEAKNQSVIFETTFNKAERLNSENQAIRRKKRLFKAVSERLDQLDMERNVPASIRILTRAFAPSKPVKDRRLLFTMMVLCGALGMGIAGALLRANQNQTLYGAEDVSTSLQMPFLGLLPVVRKDKDLPFEENPVLVESIRIVRTALLSRIDSRQGSTVLISSADIGSGKSTVAIMLAKSLARIGKKILLIDADVRKPSLSGYFGLDSEPGFIEFLAGEASDQEVIFTTDTPRLSVMPSGKRTDGTEIELIANGAFTSRINRLRRNFDITLLDSPPILPVADARIIAGQVDGTIMVVRQEKSRRADVIDALASISSSGGKLLGTIFVGSTRHSYYQRDYYYRHDNGAK